MKERLIRGFWPLLKFFEDGRPASGYRPMHRRIALVVGVLFLVIALASIYMALSVDQWAAFVPVVVFLGASLVSLVVGLLGSDRAVAKLWGVKGES